MNQKQKLPPYNSVSSLIHHSIQPLSPINRLSTPLRSKLPNSSVQSYSPMNFSTAIQNYTKSPISKENNAYLQNQSPLMDNFNPMINDYAVDRAISPKMTSKLYKKTSVNNGHFANHKSMAYEGSQSFQPTFSQGNNFESTLRSLAVKPFGYLNHKKQTSNTDSINNFKSIIDRQNQNQKFIKIEDSKYQIPLLKKSSSSSNNTKRIFNSCIENVDRSRPLSNKSMIQTIQCINNDGNQAKYKTIPNEQNDEELFYCSKCTVLLVSQGFILQEIINSEKAQLKSEQNQRYINIQQLCQCKDKLSSLVNDLLMREEMQLSKIQKYYNNIQQFIEQSLRTSQKQLKKCYQDKISLYQQTLQQLQDYILSIRTQKRYRQPEEEQKYLMISQIKLMSPLYLKLDQNSMMNLHSSFIDTFKNKYQLNSSIGTAQSPMRKKQQKQTVIAANHGLRFSFQRVLNDISSKKAKMQNMINSLPEQQQVSDNQNEDGCLIQKKSSRKNAFRDLFPQNEEMSQVTGSVFSPTFKNF